MPDYSWPPMDKRRVMGKPHQACWTGSQKSSGTSQVPVRPQLPKGLLFGCLLTSPHAHARVTQHRYQRSRKTARRHCRPRHQRRRARNCSGRARRSRPWPPTAEEHGPRRRSARSKSNTKFCPTWCDEAGSQPRSGSQRQTRRRSHHGRSRKRPSRKPTLLAKVTTESPSSPTAAWSRMARSSSGRATDVNYWPSTQNVSAIGGELARATQGSR